MIRCLAVDDELLALEVMENYIEKVPFLRLVQLCSTPLEALQVLSRTRVDLLLLDIDMPELSGLQLLRTLKDPPYVIFTTAYPQFALEGFEVNAVDYLVKPVPFERFVTAIGKVQARMQASQNREEVAPLTTASEQAYIFIKTDYKTLRVDVADILFIEGKKDYVLIHSRGKQVMTLLSLNRLLEKLPSTNFLRVHRSFIVAMNKIESVERNRIQIGQVEIPIGDLYREALMKRLG